MITGYSSNEIKQMHPLNFFQKEEETLLKDVIEKVFVLGTGEVSAHLYTKEKKIIPYYFNGNKATINQKDYLIGMGLDISKQVESDNNLKERAEQIQILTAHLQLIREEERTRIAREIHDELGQQLTGLKMDTSWIGKKIIDNDIVKSKIKEMVVLLDNTIQTVRRISSDLRPGILDDLGLVPALEWQSEEFEKRTGIISEFDGFLLNDNLESNLSTNIFRVHQEALTNVARHSGATKVITKIKEFECNIVLIVHDNGNGFDVDNTKFRNSLGIIGMRERAYLFKGDLYIDSKKLSGTTVKLTVPSSIAVKNL